jgi:hypothetical protein
VSAEGGTSELVIPERAFGVKGPLANFLAHFLRRSLAGLVLGEAFGLRNPV